MCITTNGSGGYQTMARLPATATTATRFEALKTGAASVFGALTDKKKPVPFSGGAGGLQPTQQMATFGKFRN